MKKTITQWLFMELDHHMKPDTDYNYVKTWAPVIYRFKANENESRVFLSAMNIDVEVPDDFDATGRSIAALEEKKRKAGEAYFGLVQEINQQISKLQAIGNEVAA